MKNYAITGIILLLAIPESFSQLNESDTVKFQLRAGVTGNYQQGNVEVLNIGSRIDCAFLIGESWVFKSQNISLYQAFYSAKADNDIFSRNYLYFKPQYRVYPFAIADLSANFRRKINNRYFVGAGATYQLVNTKNNELKFSASAVYEATRFSGTTYNYGVYDGYDAINLWRATLFTAGWNYLWEKRIRCCYDTYWQPAINNIKNYRTQIEIGIDFPVSSGLSCNALLAYAHENVVIRNIRQNDKMLTFGLAYSFKRR